MNKPHENAVGLEDVKGLVAWLLMLPYCAEKTIQIYTRVPGYTGRSYYSWHLWVGLLGSVTVPPFLLGVMEGDPRVYNALYVSAWVMQVIHYLAMQSNRRKGAVIHSYEPGLPILIPKFVKNKPLEWGYLISDIFGSMALGMVCFMLHTPMLGFWYYLVVPVSVLASHAVLKARDDLRDQARDDAAVEAQMVHSRTEGRYDELFDQSPSQPDLPDDFQSLLKRERRSE